MVSIIGMAFISLSILSGCSSDTPGSSEYLPYSGGVCPIGETYYSTGCVYTGTNGSCPAGYTYMANIGCEISSNICPTGEIYVTNVGCELTQGLQSVSCSLVPVAPTALVVAGVPTAFEIVTSTGVVTSLELTQISDGEPLYTQLPYLLTSGNTFGVTWGSPGTFSLSVVAETTTGLICNSGLPMQLTVVVAP